MDTTMSMKVLYQEISDIVENDEPVMSPQALKLTAHLAKLTEEVGELAQSVNKLNGRKTNKGDRYEDILNNIEEETADAIQCLMAIAITAGIDYKSLKKRLGEKNKKYEQSLKKTNDK